MKYESELIKEIVDTRGHEKSSLHYQSECIETWIEEARGSYPKLTDYQSEWLNYIVENPIGDFPYVTLSDVTEATVENVVPYAYKSAILKGQTLVNITLDKKIVGSTYIRVEVDNNLIKPNVQYTLIVNGYSNVSRINCVDNNGLNPYFNITNPKQWNIFTTPNDLTNHHIRVYGTSVDDTLLNSIDIILVEGDYTNINTPYFTGMQSVKKPVLTTTGKNLFDGKFTKYEGVYGHYKTNILTTSEDVELRGFGDVKDELDCLTGEVTERIGEIVLDGSENWVPFNNFSFEGYSSFVATIPTLNNFHNNDVISIINDKFVSTSWAGFLGNRENELIWSHDTNKIGIRVKSERASNVNEIKSFLSTNNIRINYKLATESIKTVDLNIQDQNGNTLSKIKPIEGTMHLSTSGQSIKPTFTGEIPVEAITENLASFIEE